MFREKTLHALYRCPMLILSDKEMDDHYINEDSLTPNI